MSYSKCCVPGCQDKSSSRHRLPVYEPVRFNIWKKRIAHPKFDSCSEDYIYKSYKICRSHFTEDCFSPGTKRLNANAIPTLHLPGTHNSVYTPSDSNSIKDGSLQSQVVDTEHMDQSEGIIRFVVISAEQQLNDKNTRMFSPVQYINNLPWKIMLQRKGSSLGVFLCLYSVEYDPNYKVFAEFCFKLVDQKCSSKSVTKTGQHEFRRGGTSHGFPCLIDMDKLLNPNGDFLIDNTFIVECHVACSSLLKAVDVEVSSDAAVQTFARLNDLSRDLQAERAKYILENGIGSDCVFIIDGTMIRKRASKAILAHASPVFERMFFIDGKGRGVFRVSDIDGDVFDIVLRHIYRVGWEFQSKIEATKVYYAARKYELMDLQMICVQYIWPTTLGDAWIALDCAIHYKLEDLQDAALALLRKSASKAFEMEEFLNTSLECLVLVLKQTKLSVGSELEVFDAALRWASAQCEKKNCVLSNGHNLRLELGEAIRHIRFLSMTEAQFAGSPCQSKVLTEQEKAAIIQRLATKKKEPLLLELSGITNPRQT